MLILKYGGSSLATPEHIQRRALQIKSYKNQGHDIIVVVSAMGKVTDELMQLAYKVSPSPKRRELDMLLSTGERTSMALLSMALNDLNTPAISFTGSQAGIMTEQIHNCAKIKEIKPIRVDEEIKKGNVVIIAGFQGVNPDSKEITTLGRGGSDATAIALANHYQAKDCKIMKDVPGVLSANPNWVEQPSALGQLNHQQIYEMCLWGAQVVHAQAMAFALEHKINFDIALADDPEKKSVISSHEDSSKKLRALSINGHEFIMRLQLNTNNWNSDWTNFLEKNNLIHPEILYTHKDTDNQTILWIKVTPDSSANLKTHLQKAKNLVSGLAEASSISLTFNQKIKDQAYSQIERFENFAQTGYFIRDEYTSTIIVDHNQFKDCLNEWHELTK